MRFGVGISACLIAAAGCEDRSGSRGIMEARTHARIAPADGFIYTIDSLVPWELSRAGDTAYVRIFASTSDTTCATIMAQFQMEAESMFVQSYGLRHARVQGCTEPQTTMEVPVYVGGSTSPRRMMWIAVQPDGAESHFPLDMPGADSLPPPAAPADTDPDFRPTPPPAAKPDKPKARPPARVPVKQ